MELSSGLEVFDRCQNKAYRNQLARVVLEVDKVEVSCAQYPFGDEQQVPRWIKANLSDDSYRDSIAKDLGCVTCPYPDKSMLKSFTLTTEFGKTIREIRFEPIPEDLE